MSIPYKMNKIFIIALLLSVWVAKAQQITLADDVKRSKSLDELQKSKELKYKDISGSPYLNKNFSKATLDSSKEILMLRLNSFANEMEVLVDTGIYILPKKNSFSKFTFLDSKETLVLYDSEYYTQLVDGNFQLLKKQAVKMVEAGKAPNSMISASPARFEKLKPEYFLLTNSSFTKIPKKEADFLNNFPDRKPEIEEIIKQNKIKMSDEESLIKLFTLLNEK